MPVLALHLDVLLRSCGSRQPESRTSRVPFLQRPDLTCRRGVLRRAVERMLSQGAAALTPYYDRIDGDSHILLAVIHTFDSLLLGQDRPVRC